MASAGSLAGRFSPPPSTEFVVEPTAEQIDFFRENGFLVVEHLTTEEEIAWMREIMEFIFDPANAGLQGAPIDRSGTQKEGQARHLEQAFFPETQIPYLLQTNHHRNARRFAAALLDVPIETISAWGHMIRKAPGGRSAPWHQDHAYWQPELNYHALGCWIPLHDVSVEMGAMQFIPGSHKRGLLQHHHADLPEHNLLEVSEPFDKASAVACPLRAGGATFHHYDTLHYTAPNSTDQPRLAFPMEFQQDPVLRDQPLSMPWVDETRAAVGRGPLAYVKDGKVVTLGNT
jgi:ectoine hydroxylase-related dioxygenase (phytanoyl-CoA dioxygenase family)